ncbi:MAG: hypothetical protein U0903_07670 [Planctomycetales bacterium]
MNLLAAPHKVQPSEIIWSMTTTVLVLVVLIVVAWLAQKWFRNRMGEEGSEVDYQEMLAEYRELKRQGKISEEEFKKIKRQISALDPNLNTLIPSRKSNSDEQAGSESS